MKQIIETLDWLIRNDMITRGRTQIPITANLIGCKDIVIAFEIIVKKRVNILLFLDSLIYDGLNYYNVSDDVRQWTTYEHMASETSRSYNFSGFLNLIHIFNRII